MALFSRKNISKLKDIQDVIKEGGCILIHDYKDKGDEKIIIYNTYNSEEIKIFRSVRYISWDIINDYNPGFDINEYINNKSDLYRIEGYNDERQWPKLRSIFFETLGESLHFRPLEHIIESLKKYNMELCPLMT